MLPSDAILIQTLHNLGCLKEGNSEFSPRGDNVLPFLFWIFQRNVQINFENQQRYGGLLCSKGYGIIAVWESTRLR